MGSYRVRKPKSVYAAAPEGLHLAVCCDVWESWTEDRPERWGGGIVEKTRLVFQLEEENPATGRRFEASQIYTFSLHEKARLRQHLESWRGRAFTKTELEGFDLETVIGVNCQIQVVHKIKDDAVYANITAIVPLGKGQVKLRVSENFVRRKDRTQSDTPPMAQGPAGEMHDEDVPF
jgi:hypothetical protein